LALFGTVDLSESLDIKADRMDDGRCRIEIVRPEHGKENNEFVFGAVRTGGAVDLFRFGKERIYAVYRYLGDDEGYLSLLLDIEVTHPATESCNLEWSHFASVERCFVQC
jgi:hypothetical protein